MTYRYENDRDRPTRAEAERDLAEDRRAFGYWGQPSNTPSIWPLDDPWAQQQIALRRSRA